MFECLNDVYFFVDNYYLCLVEVSIVDMIKFDID